MNKPAHIFSNGKIERHENTVRVVTEDGNTTHLPVKAVDRICLHGQVEFNNRVLDFLRQNGVTVGLFGWQGQYIGEFVPRANRKSGKTVVKQSAAYSDTQTRRRLAREIVRSSVHNMRKNIQYYERKQKMTVSSETFKNPTLEQCTGIPDILGAEARYRKQYYQNFEDIVADSNFSFSGRTYQPPEDELNALLSYGNSVLYSTVVNEIHKTGLDPTVSYLHEPSERRNSLSLDIADIFKPVVVDRTIFRIINRGQVSTDDFSKDDENRVTITDKKEMFVNEIESTLSDTIDHPRLNRNVSLQFLIRLDLYALQKDVISDGAEKYQGFKRWW